MSGLVLIAWQTVSRQRLRSVLTAISLILGVMALTSVAAADHVMKQAITRTALLTGGPAVTSSIEIASGTAADQIAQEWAELLTARFGPNTHSARILHPTALGLVGKGVQLPDVDLNLVDASLISIRPFELLDGHWFDDQKSTLAPHIVLNKAAATISQGVEGWTLRWGTRGDVFTAIQIGTVDDGSPVPGVYLDLAQAGPWQHAARIESSVRLQIHAEGIDDAGARAATRQIAHLSGRSGEIVEVARVDTLDRFDSQLNVSTRVFLAIAVIALAIAALGMLNIGLSTVAERADELALRRAFGAHRRDVVAIMLVESQLVALSAGALGVAGSAVAMPFTLSVLGAKAATAGYPLTAALVGVAAGSAAALLGAIVPAIRAARLPISSIMRG